MEKRQPPIRYVVLFPGRSGSTYLTDHMGSHPSIVANYEILSQYQRSWSQQKDFLDEMVTTKRNPRVVAIGLKTKVRDVLDWKQFATYLQQHEFKVIHLTRTNQLKLVVSVVRAELLRQQCGASNLIRDQFNEIGPTVIPLEKFERARKRIRRQRMLGRKVARLKLPTLEITYEGLLNNERAVLNQVWDFLEVPSSQTSGRTRKNTPQDLHSAVLNLDEILQHYPEMASFVDQA